MIYQRFFVFIFVIFCGCSNTPDLQKSETKILTELHRAIIASNKNTPLIDAKKIITREMIDNAKVPVLYVELSSRQNGTLTQYPGNSFGETWIGVDGATITFDRGILIASRGMGDDLMGGQTSMPNFLEIATNASYTKTHSYISKDNKIEIENFKCNITKNKEPTEIEVFNLNFPTYVYNEFCKSNTSSFENKYFVDEKSIVRKSNQYHGKVIGHIYTERLER